MSTIKALSAAETSALFGTLKTRFDKHKSRHTGIEWADVQARLEAQPEKCWSLSIMEETGGEPDVIGLDATTGEYLFCDCAAESPKGRRSLCYDQAAWLSRKEHKPTDNAADVAASMGVKMLTEAEYRHLQTLGEFDLKTSSWITTPEKVRNLGGALFCDRRFDTVFTYHNGAESYYAARGFRGMLKI